MDIVIPQYITDILTDHNECMVELKGEEDSQELYFKVNNTSGEMTFINGNIYKGDLLLGLMNGNGEFIFKDGTSYKGEFKNNFIEGKGSITYSNGNFYEGEFKHGKRHGKGFFKSMKLGFEYTGDFLEGKMTGEAEIKYSDMSSYKGGVLNGRKHGKGKIEYNDGNWYDGEWENNKKSGFGVTVWKHKNEIYEGEWADNRLNGYGTYFWFDQNRKVNVLVNRYAGGFRNGKRHGKGCFYYADGSIYIGEWYNNLKDGFAFLVQDDGNIEVQIYYKNRPFKKLDSTLLDCVYRFKPLPKVEEEEEEEQEPSKSGVTDKPNLNNQSTTSRQGRSLRNRLTNARSRNRTGADSRVEAQSEIGGKPTRNNNRSVRINRTNTNTSRVTTSNNVNNSRTGVNSMNNLVSEEGSAPNIPKPTQPSVPVKKPLRRKKTQHSFSMMMNSELGTNPYYKLIDFRDIFNLVDPAKRSKVKKEFLIVLLRNHSELKAIYDHYKRKFIKSTSREGHCLRFEGFWQFLEEIRFQDCNFWLPNLHEFYTKGKKNDYQLHFDKTLVELRINYLKELYAETLGITTGNPDMKKKTEAAVSTPNFRKEVLNFNENYPPNYFNKHDFLPSSKRKSKGSNSGDKKSNEEKREEQLYIFEGDMEKFMLESSNISFLDKSTASAYIPKMVTIEDYKNLEMFSHSYISHIKNFTRAGSKIFDPMTPLLFRHFVDIFMRSVILKHGSVNVQTPHIFQKYVKDHVLLIINGRKSPKNLVPEGNLILEKCNELEGDMIELTIEKIHKLMKVDIPKNRYHRVRSIETFYEARELLMLLDQNGYDMKSEDNVNLFVNCLEYKMDPEQSFRRFYKKKERIPSKRLNRFYNLAAKKLHKRLQIRLMKRQVKDILLLFLSRANKLIAKDKKFSKKIVRLVRLFSKKLQYNHPKLKTKPARIFPTSQKDLNVENIQEVKRIQKEKERERRRKKRQRAQERKERIMMGLEDYDVQFTEESEEEDEDGSEELSLEDSIGGESFYNYTESAKQKYGMKGRPFNFTSGSGNISPLKTPIEKKERLKLNKA